METVTLDKDDVASVVHMVLESKGFFNRFDIRYSEYYEQKAVCYDDVVKVVCSRFDEAVYDWYAEQDDGEDEVNIVCEYVDIESVVYDYLSNERNYLNEVRE
mgnify:CR=1 FL=1